jgi:hypothetical protein
MCRYRFTINISLDEDVGSWYVAAREVEKVGLLPERQLAVGVIPIWGCLASKEKYVVLSMAMSDSLLYELTM